MHAFPLHTTESAPALSQPVLRQMQERFGFLPNVMATAANSPVLLNGLAGVFGQFHGGSFDECEKQALLLTNAVAFQCPWTVAAHSTFALEDGMTAADVDALRRGAAPADAHYAALSAMSRALLAKRGNISADDLAQFTAAGYAPEQLLEIVAGLGISTMTAISTNLARTPVEARFQPQLWVAAA